jgi:large subunit ribosomal protein L10
MSKQIKQMEMDALGRTFAEVRDLVLLSVTGMPAQAENQLRLALRKKNIRLQVVKNSLARRVFDRLGLKADSVWEGPTTLAWGGGSLAELSRELDTALRKNDKVKFKGAVADGQPVTFAQALKMPTRTEAIGRVVSLVLSPAARIAGALRGPAGRVAGQVKTLREREGAPAEGAAAPSP